MSGRSPFRVLRRTPVAGKVEEILVPGGVWALELQGGAQPGLRLGIDRDAGVQESIPFDALGRRVPLDGVERFVLYWPSSLANLEQLALEAWTVPGRYEHRDGQVELQPAALVLAREELVFGAGGALTLGPFEHLPYDQVAVGQTTRLARGARLVAQFAFTGTGVFTCDVLLYADTIGAGTMRALKGLRGVGVPSAPVTEQGIDFDVAAPLGDFQFRVGVSGAANVGCLVYLLLGP